MALLYVTGPISSTDPAQREMFVKRAMAVAIRLMERGHAVFCPHLTHYLDLYAIEGGVHFTHADWLRQDMAILPKCDGLVATMDEDAMQKSKGSMIEREYAAIHGLPYYRNVNEVPRAA